MSMYYDRQGNPMDVMDWATLFEEERHIGNDRIGDVYVSTVWIGINHQWGDGPPLIFETMIFGGEHDQYQERYSTEEEAVEGHAKALELVRNT